MECLSRNMVLTEEQAMEIRSTGMSVIEWKNYMRKIIGANKIVKKLKDACKILCDRIYDFVDTVLLLVNEIRDYLNLPVSRRFKFVQMFCKLGYNKRKLWVVTRHTWLARSNC